MSSLRQAIRLTRAYARFFDFDLTAAELHHWLITPKRISLRSLPKFPVKLSPVRRLRLATTQQKLRIAHQAVQFLRLIPTIRCVAVTGSLAMNNAKPHDDIDLMIITQTRTLWLTRLIVTPILRLMFKSRLPQHPPTTGHNSLCLNLWLDTSALVVPFSKRSLYTAHEVLQVKPLLDRQSTYQRFLKANPWVRLYLSNAWKATVHPVSTITPDINPILPFLAILNFLAYQLQYLYMRPKITSETIGLHFAYFHPRSLASKLDQVLNNIP